MQWQGDGREGHMDISRNSRKQFRGLAVDLFYMRITLEANIKSNIK